MSQEPFHTPVLVDLVLTYLINDRSGIYVDGTLGGGGHSLAILKKLTTRGRLIGIDWDEQAIQKAQEHLRQEASRVSIRKGNFNQITGILAAVDIKKVDGILLDLGVSSFQIDTSERGFSYLASGPLDMRASQETKLSAEEVVNDYPEHELARIFKQYGEENKARSIAQAIVRERHRKRITTTQELVKIIESRLPFGQRIKSLARIFQAIRIEVNKELENLQSFLDQSLDVLKPGGRLVIIAYHSLEDRLVKNFFYYQSHPCECPPELPVCGCGKKPALQVLIRKVVRPSAEEMKANPRSRSAKLRAAEKI
jgi:16S rRNA (cytosine1402-N4)-methyltransferase